jgi:hypothetical protein
MTCQFRHRNTTYLHYKAVKLSHDSFKNERKLRRGKAIHTHVFQRNKLVELLLDDRGTRLIWPSAPPKQRNGRAHCRSRGTAFTRPCMMGVENVLDHSPSV